MSQNKGTAALGFDARGRSLKRGSGPSVCAFLLPPHFLTPRLMMMIHTSHHLQLFLTQMMMIPTMTLLLHHIKRETLAIMVTLLILVMMLMQMSQNSLLILVEILVQMSNVSVQDIHGGIGRQNNHLSLTSRTNVTMSLSAPRIKTCLLEPTSVQLLVRG